MFVREVYMNFIAFPYCVQNFSFSVCVLAHALCTACMVLTPSITLEFGIRMQGHPFMVMAVLVQVATQVSLKTWFAVRVPVKPT